MMKPPGLHPAVLMLVLATSLALRAQDATVPQSWTASDGRVIQAKFIKLEREAVMGD